MTDNIDQRVDELLTGDPDPRQFRPQRKKSVVIGGIAIAIIVAAAVFIPLHQISVHKEQFHKSLSQHLVTLAQGRVDVITTWRDGVLTLAGRVVDDDFYKEFATDMDLSVGNIQKLTSPQDDEKCEEDEDCFEPSLEARTELMKNVLVEYVQNTGFLAAHLMNREATINVTTDFNFVLNQNQNDTVLKVFETAKAYIAPTEASAEGFVMNLYLPLFPVHETKENMRVVAVLLLTRPITDRVAEFLKPSPHSQKGESYHILQKNLGKIEKHRPGNVKPLAPLDTLDLNVADQGLDYMIRQSVNDGAEVYSVALTVPGTPWVLVQETSAELARQELRNYNRTIIAIAVLVVVAVIVAFGAFWWRIVGDHNRNLATQFQSLAAQIAAQKRFLDSINNTIQDHIGLKDRDGNYRYANPAFATAVGRTMDRLLGQDDEAIFGHGTAERLKISDQKVGDTGQGITVDEEIYLGSKKHFMQISKVPLRDDDGELSGLVSVTRDITDVVEQREKRELAVKQTVVALVRAIELRDPYLGGHSRRVAGFAGHIAKFMGARAEQISTVEVAANLSQIGKLSISRNLLNKPDRLTNDEINIIQQHVNHAAEVLKDVDFGLPVFEAIYQMNERLDGGGYPQGLAGDDITFEARILAVCDVFCARVEPRSYRPSIKPLEAVDVLTQNNSRYDSEVVEALRAIVTSPEGDKLMQDLHID